MLTETYLAESKTRWRQEQAPGELFGSCASESMPTGWGPWSAARCGMLHACGLWDEEEELQMTGQRFATPV
jgi:hypothetical protein